MYLKDANGVANSVDPDQTAVGSEMANNVDPDQTELDLKWQTV